MTFLSFMKILVSISIIIDIVAFFPQIRSLIKADKPSRDISISAWSVWTYSTFVWVVYIIYTTDDLFLIIESIAAAVGCSTVLLLAIYNQKFRFKEK